MPHAFVILAAAADFGQANVVTGTLDYVSKLPKDIDGQPVEYREKEMIYCGQFFDEKTGNPFTIDQGRLDKWVNNFQRWTAAGNPVPLPAVDHFKGDEKLQGTSLGNLLTLERRGDKLYGLHQFIGADAIAAAARNDSSVFVEAGKIDGKGNVYDEVLTHNLITPKPLIPGLSRFKIAAASHANNPITILSEKTPERSIPMPLLDELKTALKIDAGADEAAVSKAFKDHMTAVAASLATLETTKTALSASQTALAAAQPKVPDEYTLGLICESLDTKRQAAVAACSPAVVDEFDGIFYGADKKPTPLALSQVAGKTLIGRLYDVLGKIKGIPLGQMSGVSLAASLPMDSRTGPAGVAAAQGGQQPAEDPQMKLLKQQCAAYNPAAK